MSTLTPSSRWEQRFFFFGHIAKGVVYVLLGGLAVAAVIGASGSGPGGFQEVIRWIQDQPFGQILLVLLAIGLLCYCAWRWTKAIYDLGHDGDNKKGIAKRTGYAASGTFYGLMAVYSISLALGNGGSGGGGQQDMLGQILSEDWGQIVVGILGLIMIGVGIFQLKRGLNEEYMHNLRTQSMSRSEDTMYRNFGKAGHVARAIIYGIIAYFLLRVAMSSDASQFRGTGGALEYIGQGFGVVLLALVGLGLLLYGAFMFVKARYQRVPLS